MARLAEMLEQIREGREKGERKGREKSREHMREVGGFEDMGGDFTMRKRLYQRKILRFKYRITRLKAKRKYNIIPV